MIKNLINPKDLVICLKFLIHLSLTDDESYQSINIIIRKHMGTMFAENEESAEKIIEGINDNELIQLTIDSFLKLQNESEVTKKEIMQMIEEIIFADEDVLPSESKFYDMAKRYLNVQRYEVNPSVELFEYLNVLNLVSSSDFANIDEFAEIWVKYMGPDIRIYYNEARQNLKDLSLEDQIQKVGYDLGNLKEIEDEQKLSIRSMVEEIIFADDEFTDEEKILYDLLLENMEVKSGISSIQSKKGFKYIFSSIEKNKYINIFINCLIVFTGILVGVETDITLVSEYPVFFFTVDQVVKYIFLIEILIRFFPKWDKPLVFLSDGWNIFDSLLVIASFLPFGSNPFILRILRLLRFSRIFHRVTQLRMIIISLIHSLKPIGFVGIILILMIYIYGVLGTTTFSKNDPVHFGNLGISMVSLVRAATFEDWTDLMYIQMYGCDKFGYEDSPEKCSHPSEMPVFSVFFFVSFILISGLIIINFFIGVIIQSMFDSKEHMRQQDELAKTLNNVDLIVRKIRSKNLEKLIDDHEKDVSISN